MGREGWGLDRTAVTFWGFCILILAVLILCFHVKNNQLLEEVDYRALKECTKYIRIESDEINHLRYADQLEKKLVKKMVSKDDVELIKAECTSIISEIGEKRISERVIVYQNII